MPLAPMRELELGCGIYFPAPKFFMERDMTDLIKFVIEMDPELVCESCGTNDSVHYNYTIFHTGGIARDDELGEFGVWCNDCGSETTMVHPDEAEDAA